MANVKPTKEIWEQINAKIEEMYKARINHASDWANYGLTQDEFDKQLLDAAWPEAERQICQQLGEKYFQRYEQVYITLCGSTSNTGHTVRLPHSMFLPDEFSGSYSHNGKRRLATSKPELVAIQSRRRDAMAKLNNERDHFRDKIRDLYNTAPSVNALIKLFPAAMDLLPVKVIERLNKKSERRTVKSLAGMVDTNTLAAGLLMAKMGA